MNLRTAVVTASLILLGAATAHANQALVDEAMKKTPEELMKVVENEHPAVCYILAMKLFDAGRKDEAVFWFYAGQLRYRFHLAARPDLDPSGDAALLSSLSEVVGRPINEYAFGDIAVLDATLEKVKRWDEKTPNGFTSKTEYEKQWKSTRDGMEKLVVYIRENGDKIRAQRNANGLENRN